MLLMAHRPRDEGSIYDSANAAAYSTAFSYATRQSAGQKRPCDMDSLKMAISQAVPGTGQVKRAITDATFQPRAPAFTSLIQTCAKFRQVQKAIEVFDTMANSEAIDVKPNTVHYSALISACATAGQWQEALEVFESMKQAAVSDPGCTPNTITYSSLISACAAGSRLDKALQVYDEMQEAGLEPDHITYSTLISAYEKAGEFAEALALLDKLHAAGGAASAETYTKVMQYLAGKQLWNRALEVFLELQTAGVALSQPLCLALLSVFEACGQSGQAQDVLTAASDAAIPLTVELYNAVLRCCILAQHGERAIEVWEEMQNVGVTPNVASAEALLQSCQDCPHLSAKVDSLTAAFQPALAALHKLPAANAFQSMTAQNMALLSKGMAMPSAVAYESLLRLERPQVAVTSSSSGQLSQTASTDALQRMPSGATDALRAALNVQGAGQSAAAPRTGLLPADALLGPHAAAPATGSKTPASGPDTGLGHAAKRPGSGLSAGAPTTPDLQSEGEEDVSPQEAGQAS